MPPPRIPAPDTHVLARRFLAHVVDWIVILAIAVPLAIASFPSEASSIILFSVAAAVFVLLQGATGYTPGKRLLGIRVIRADRGHPGIRAALIRTLPLIIEQWGVFALVAMLRSPARQRIGDRWARTYVVRDDRADQSALPGAMPREPLDMRLRPRS